jgi:hypothetical protein
MTGNNWGIVTHARAPALMNWRLISSVHKRNEVEMMDKENDLVYFNIKVRSCFMRRMPS